MLTLDFNKKLSKKGRGKKKHKKCLNTYILALALEYNPFTQLNAFDLLGFLRLLTLRVVYEGKFAVSSIDA